MPSEDIFLYSASSLYGSDINIGSLTLLAQLTSNKNDERIIHLSLIIESLSIIFARLEKIENHQSNIITLSKKAKGKT